MIEPELVDLASALARVGTRMQQFAAAIIREENDPNLAHALADILDETARQLRLTHPTEPEAPSWKSAPSAMAAASTPVGASPTVGGVEASDRSPAANDDPTCPRCDDTGVMRWQQPVPDGSGGMVLREMSHGCTCEAAQAAGAWRHPAAESDRVIDDGSTPVPRRVRGQAAEANRIQWMQDH